MADNSNPELGMNADLSEEEAEKKAAAERKEAERREELERAFNAFFYRLNQQDNYPGFGRLDKSELPEDARLPGFITTGTLTNLYKEGVFYYKGKESPNDQFLQFKLKDGALKCLETQSFIPFEKKCSAMMDFLGGETGARIITIDWDDKEAISDEKLNKVLDLAENKVPPRAIKFGPNVEEYLLSNHTNKHSKLMLETDRMTGKTQGKQILLSDADARDRREYFWKRREALETRSLQEANTESQPKIEARQKFDYGRYAEELKKAKKLDTTAGEAAVKQEIFGKDPATMSPPDKKKALGTALDHIESELKVFNAAKENIETHFNDYERKLQKDDAGRFSIQEADRTSMQGCLDHNRTYRDGLINEMEPVYNDLMLRQDICFKEIATMAADDPEVVTLKNRVTTIGQALGNNAADNSPNENIIEKIKNKIQNVETLQVDAANQALPSPGA